MESQDQLLEMLSRCMRCPDMCGFACPVYATRKTQAVSPSNMAHNALKLYTGDLPDSPDSRNILYQCMACRRCSNWCIYDDIDLPGMITMVRAFTIRKYGEEIIPLRPRQMKANYLESGIPYAPVENGGIPDAKISASLRERSSNNGDVLFYAGCVARQSQPEVITASLDILEKLGIDYAFDLEAEPCCGSPLTDLGFFDMGKMAAEKVLAYVKASGCRQVLTACPQCAYTLATQLEKFGAALDVPVAYLGDYLAQQLTEGALSLRAADPLQLTFDDGVYLARYLESTEAPRKLLASIGGFTLLEMASVEKAAFPSAAYHALPDVNTEMAISAQRFQEAVQTGADVLVTASPLAKKALLEAANHEMQIMDLMELVAQQLA